MSAGQESANEQPASMSGITTSLFGLTVYANTMKASGEVSMNLEFPEHLVIYVTAFCLLTFTLVILRDILNNIRKLKST